MKKYFFIHMYVFGGRSKRQIVEKKPRRRDLILTRILFRLIANFCLHFTALENSVRQTF